MAAVETSLETVETAEAPELVVLDAVRVLCYGTASRQPLTRMLSVSL